MPRAVWQRRRIGCGRGSRRIGFQIRPVLRSGSPRIASLPVRRFRYWLVRDEVRAEDQDGGVGQQNCWDVKIVWQRMRQDIAEPDGGQTGSGSSRKGDPRSGPLSDQRETWNDQNDSSKQMPKAGGKSARAAAMPISPIQIAACNHPSRSAKGKNHSIAKRMAAIPTNRGVGWPSREKLA